MSFLDLSDDSEESFLNFSPKKKKSTLTSWGSSGKDESEEDFTYKQKSDPAQKKKRRESTSSRSSAAVTEDNPSPAKSIYALTVNMFKYNGEEYTQIGDVGTAILYSGDKQMFYLHVYYSRERNLFTLPLSPTFEYTYQIDNGAHFGSFRDERDILWSIRFNSDEDALKFSSNISIAIFYTRQQKTFILDVSSGSGSAADIGDYVEVQYQAFAISSLVVLDKPLFSKKEKFTIGESPNEGFNAGLVGLQKGGNRLLVVPKHLLSDEYTSSPIVFNIRITRKRRRKTPAVQTEVEISDVEEKSSLQKAKMLGAVNVMPERTEPAQNSSDYSNPATNNNHNNMNTNPNNPNPNNPNMNYNGHNNGHNPYGNPQMSNQLALAPNVGFPNQHMGYMNGYPTPNPYGIAPIQPVHQPAPQPAPQPVPQQTSQNSGAINSDTIELLVQERQYKSSINSKLETMMVKLDNVSDKINQVSYRENDTHLVAGISAKALLQTVQRIVGDNERLSAETEQKSARVDRLTSQVQDLIEQNQIIKDENDKYLDERNQKSQNYSAKVKKQIDTLRDENHSLQIDLTESSANLERSTRRFEKLKAKHMKLNQYYQKTVKERDEAIEKVSETQMEAQESFDSQSELQKQLHEEKKLKEKAMLERDQARNELQLKLEQARSEIDIRDEQLRNLTEQLVELKERFTTEFKSRESNWKNEKKEMEARYNLLREELNSSKLENQQYISKVEADLKAQNDKDSDNLKKLWAEKHRAAIEINNSQWNEVLQTEREKVKVEVMQQAKVAMDNIRMQHASEIEQVQRDSSVPQVGGNAEQVVKKAVNDTFQYLRTVFLSDEHYDGQFVITEVKNAMVQKTLGALNKPKEPTSEEYETTEESSEETEEEPVSELKSETPLSEDPTYENQVPEEQVYEEPSEDEVPEETPETTTQTEEPKEFWDSTESSEDQVPDTVSPNEDSPVFDQTENEAEPASSPYDLTLSSEEEPSVKDVEKTESNEEVKPDPLDVSSLSSDDKTEEENKDPFSPVVPIDQLSSLSSSEEAIGEEPENVETKQDSESEEIFSSTAYQIDTTPAQESSSSEDFFNTISTPKKENQKDPSKDLFSQSSEDVVDTTPSTTGVSDPFGVANPLEEPSSEKENADALVQETDDVIAPVDDLSSLSSSDEPVESTPVEIEPSDDKPLAEEQIKETAETGEQDVFAPVIPIDELSSLSSSEDLLAQSSEVEPSETETSDKDVFAPVIPVDELSSLSSSDEPVGSTPEKLESSSEEATETTDNQTDPQPVTPVDQLESLSSDEKVDKDSFDLSSDGGLKTPTPTSSSSSEENAVNTSIDPASILGDTGFSEPSNYQDFLAESSESSDIFDF
eukprot:TRINITY_DN534_c0_g1_i2.p1 TRINITY_DN534_c0_g1~~TRINITY_DN534_c0_g1_i2.p1  ORF type:complete len:1362 (-),score=457.47 TRINITY_DN534_c0_g1_i2:68-4153(-)